MSIASVVLRVQVPKVAPSLSSATLRTSTGYSKTSSPTPLSLRYVLFGTVSVNKYSHCYNIY